MNAFGIRYERIAALLAFITHNMSSGRQGELLERVHRLLLPGLQADPINCLVKGNGGVALVASARDSLFDSVQESERIACRIKEYNKNRAVRITVIQQAHAITGSMLDLKCAMVA